MVAVPRHIRRVPVRLLPALFLIFAVLPLPARAVSTLVVFSASEFLIGGVPAEGLVSGTLEVEDLDGDGLITAFEVQEFSFFSDFAGTLLDGSGDLASHAVFDLPGVTGTPVVLAPGFGTNGFGTNGLGFIETGGFPGLPGGLGNFGLLTIADGVLGLAGAASQGGPGLVSAVSGNLEFVSAAPSPVPLPGSAGLLFAALAGAVFWRRQRI